MKRLRLFNTLRAAALIGATTMATGALAESPRGAYGYGMGPGMMGGGSGMMGGYGMGHGMMGGYGMGPGMMGGYGMGHGMGHGMMGGFGSGVDLNLSAEQRSKIARIQEDVRRKHWDMMGKMQEEQLQMNEQYSSDTRDDAMLSKNHRKMLDLRQQMFDLSLSAQRQIDAVLTKEQHDKLKRGR